MKNYSKREKIMVAIMAVLISCLIFSLIAWHNTQVQRDNLNAQVISQNKSFCELADDRDRMVDYLAREHLVVLRHDTKLLVANLAWLDFENDTYYMDAFLDMSPEEGNSFERLKKLFDEDKEARERAITIVSYSSQNKELYSVTSEYYDYLVSDEYTETPTDVAK